MARGFSKAILTGNLVRDPELRTTPSGAQVCSFTVAVNRNFKASDGSDREEVSYIDCTAWGAPAGIINQYARKGTAILVSGRLRQHSFEDKDGNKRSRVEVVLEDFNFLGGPRSDDGSSSNNSYSNSAPAAEPAAAEGEDIIPDDVPEGEIDLGNVPF